MQRRREAAGAPSLLPVLQVWKSSLPTPTDPKERERDSNPGSDPGRPWRVLGATQPSPRNRSRFRGSGSCPASRGELREGGPTPARRREPRAPGAGAAATPPPASGPGRRPRPPRGRRRPSPSEEAARLPAAWAGDIGAPTPGPGSAQPPLLAS